MTGSSHLLLRQRADYTYKYNLRTGRHGWLRLTPAYSVKIVEELIQRCNRPVRIFDPFCGTATTALSAAYHGHEAVTNDINPFLVWFGQTKTAQYSPEVIENIQQASEQALVLVRTGEVEAIKPPPIHNIQRWWSESSIQFLCQLSTAIHTVTVTDSQERSILLVAFCRTLIALSNAAFNHQSMSFKDSNQMALDFNFDMNNLYAEDIGYVIAGAGENPQVAAKVLLGDARNPSDYVEGTFDLIITSPPYANRMSYIRELRPYMYWLNFLKSGRAAGELDWLSIGGTWGIATSRLADWQPEVQFFEHSLLSSALNKIAHQDNKNGRILANYVAKYFDDMWAHFQGIRSILSHGAEIHYIVGNSTFYNVLLPVEKLYMIMLERLGFRSVECRAIRKRNSKKELIEFDVSAIWPG